jgi:hypothetical protein
MQNQAADERFKRDAAGFRRAATPAMQGLAASTQHHQKQQQQH